MVEPAEPERSFADLGLPEPLLAALRAVGYERPTPIQARTVPPLLAGRDVLGHAPTGTGKTAAFALPILARLAAEPAPDTSPGKGKGGSDIRALVLTPTRELAIQVAEAFTRYASTTPGLRVLPVYGGQDYAVQLKALSRGVQIVVGTPGRVSDHLRRGTMAIDGLRTLVLDEADEMLRMGFVDEVEWILEKTPASRQTALFSATMPPPIRRIAQKHLNNPEEIGIEGRRSAATTIRQRVWIVGGMDKLEALTRILEVERFDAMLVFVRTKSATVELAEKLEARGFAAQAMNGDMPQKERERQVDKLKRGTLDILVATDVVARGLDVDRISHVVNFDIPYDTEAYVHRIGRTGRAGRSGEAILFVAPRERRLLGAIEHATKQRIEPLELPSVAAVNERRIEDFEVRIDEVLANTDLAFLEGVAKRFAAGREVPMERVAAALASLSLGERPLLLEERKARPGKRERDRQREREREGRGASRGTVDGRGKAEPSRHASTRPEAPTSGNAEVRPSASPTPTPTPTPTTASTPLTAHASPGSTVSPDLPAPPVSPEPPTSSGSSAPHDSSAPSGSSTSSVSPPVPPAGSDEAAAKPPRERQVQPGIPMERFRVEVGSAHGMEPSNLVGAIANEADIRAEFIGRIEVREDHSIVELPEGMPKFMLKDLKRVWVCGRKLAMSRLATDGDVRTPREARPPSPDGKRDARKPRDKPRAGRKRDKR